MKTRKTLPTINDAKALDELGGSGAGGGDMPDLQSLHLTVMDHNLGTLVPSTLAFIQHGDVRALMRRHPHLGDLLWRDTLIEAAVFRQWILGLGRRSAHERIAHLLCELLVRLRAVELVEDHAFTLPVCELALNANPRADCH